MFLFHSFYCFYVIFILLSCFIFSFLHFPLSGPVLTNISLPIIPCMIVYVTNNKEPWTLNLFRSEKSTSKLCQQRWKHNLLKIVFPPLLQQFWSDWTHMYKSLVFGDEFLAHLKSHQRCSAAFCRPVKFFHTDWIIISLWSLSYTQRHCHVRIEKGPVQTVNIKLKSPKI